MAKPHGQTAVAGIQFGGRHETLDSDSGSRLNPDHIRVRTNTATLAEQKMCEEQARTKFHEDYDGTKGFEYTSHFDARASVCYIMVHEAVNSGSPIVSFRIYDAFEGRVYASYRWMNSEHKKL